MLFWTIQALLSANYARQNCVLSEILIAARVSEFAAIENALQSLKSQNWRLVEGGATRQDSVKNAVEAAKSEWVLVHDAARPCLEGATVEKTLEMALKTGAAIAAIPVADTVKMASSSAKTIEKTLDRNRIWLAQTPQIFRREPFLAALQNASHAGFCATDCASILEWSGAPVALVEGEISNFKVTFAPDLVRAETWIQQKMQKTEENQ